MMVQQMKVVACVIQSLNKMTGCQCFIKKNEGLSQARNDGMKQAHGDYLIFIDSDDYIHPEMIQSLYEQLVQEDADVSSCGVMNVYANDESPQSANQDDYFVCDSQTFLKEYLIGEKNTWDDLQ